MKKLVACLAFFLTLISNTLYTEEKKTFDFLTGTAHDFIVRITDNIHQQREFLSFYNTINKKLRDAGDKKRKEGWYHFNRIAMERMPIEHPQWYAQIKPFVTDINAILDPTYDQLRKAIRFFMTRYGAYQEFLRRTKIPYDEQTIIVKTEEQKDASIWNTIRSSFTSSIAYVNDSFKSGWQYMRSKISA